MSPKRRPRATPPAEPVAQPRWERPLPVIKVVGISGSGKSTLVRGLRAAGYDARPVSQEHSSVPNLWQQFDPPAVLIYLNARLANQQARRPDVTWSKAAHDDEVARLAHARDHADLRIDTGEIGQAGVLALVLHFLESRQVRRHHAPLPPLPNTGSAGKSK